MKNPEHDILIYGDLCAFDLQFGEFLARKGLRVHVARKKREQGESITDVPAGFLQALKNISHVGGPTELLALARKSRMVTSPRRGASWIDASTRHGRLSFCPPLPVRSLRIGPSFR